MITPVMAHPTCDLDRQRRLREARIDGAARAGLLPRPGRLDRILRRRPRPRADFVTDLQDRGDDVWRALRF